MKKELFPYQIVVGWSEVDDSFEARVPAIRHCLAYGETEAKAIKEVKIAAKLMLETLAAEGRPVPKPDTNLERLARLADILKMSVIAEKAGISPQTLASKMQRGTALTKNESEKIGQVLLSHGVQV